MKSKSFYPLLGIGGTLELLKFLNNKNEPVKFKEMRDLINPKTNKKYSSATISKSIKNLEENEIIENKIIIKNKQKILGYSLTEKGSKSLDILNEAEKKYEKL